MNESVREYINKFSDEVKELYNQLKSIIYDSVSHEVEEKLWAKLPSIRKICDLQLLNDEEIYSTQQTNNVMVGILKFCYGGFYYL